MNTADAVVILVILVFGIIGLAHGFVESVFKILSFFISVFVALKFYPAVANILMKTSLYLSLQASIEKNILKLLQEGEKQVSNTVGSFIESLALPQFMKDMLAGGSNTDSVLNNQVQIAESISINLATIIINILSVILLFIAVRLLLMLLKYIFTGLAKLPVLKQMDRAAGFAVGIVEGILVVYLLMAVLTLFSSAQWFSQIHNELNRSLLAGYLYENNMLLNAIFPQ